MAASAKVKLPQSLQPVEDLLLWRDVTKSAAALGGVTVAYVLLEWSGIPLLTMLSNIGLLSSLLCFVWALVARALSMAGPADHLPHLLRSGIDEAVAKQAAEKLRVSINKALAVVRRVLSGDEIGLSLKTAAALYVAGALGRIATPVGLLFTAVLALFTLPKLYEMRKDDVDAGISTARSHAERHLSTAKVKVGEVVSRLTPRKAPPPAATHKDE